MKNFVVFVIVAVILFSGSVGWAAEVIKSLPEKVTDVRYAKCPMMGGDTKEEVTLLRDGKVYHFCCPGCSGGFEKNFEENLKKIKDPVEVDLKITNTNGKCPVTGEPAVESVFRVRGDSITFYCCKECIDKDKAGKPAPDEIKSGAKPAPGKPAVEEKGPHSGHKH